MRLRRVQIHLSILVIIASIAGSALAGSTATITGRVTDPQGAIMAGVKVEATNVETNLTSTGETNSEGLYVISNLPPGRYRVTIQKQGFQTIVKPDVILHVQDVVGLNFSMQIGSISQSITVEGGAPLVQTGSTEVSQVIQKSEIDTLPVVARTFTSLALLTPTVQVDANAGGLSIGGQRGFNNDHLVDGGANRRQLTGGQLTSFSQDWIEEFRVHTNGYEAQFGNASGGVINAVTRSGGNQFHGRAFGFFRVNRFDAVPKFTTVKPALEQQRPGGYFSGPIKKDRLFFFGGVEYLNTDQASIVTSPLEVCAPPATRDPVTRNCVVPVGNNNKLTLIKGDWKVSDNHTVNARYNREDFSNFNDIVGGFATVEIGLSADVTNYGISGALTSVINARSTNELRVVYNGQNAFTAPNSSLPFQVIRPSGFLGVFRSHGLIGQGQVQALDNLSLVRGSHTIKLGATYSNIRFNGDFRNLRDGQFFFVTDRPFDLADRTTYPLQFEQVLGGSKWDERGNLFGVFAQDSWRILPRLTVNYGLRYDFDDSLEISGARKVHSFSPRLGVAVSLDKSDKTVLRVSGGLFHDAEQTNLALIFILNTLLAERTIIVNWSPFFGCQFNPFCSPGQAVPTQAQITQAQDFLGQAFAQNRAPDLSNLPPSFRLLPVTNGIDKNFTVPQTQQITAGFSRELTRTMSVTADFIYSKSRFLLVFRNTNINPDGLTRPDPNFGFKGDFGSFGRGDYKALALRFDMRQSRRSAGVSYTLSKCVNNAGTVLTGGFGATSPFDLDVDKGPCDTDIRHTLVGRGSYNLPLGIESSMIYAVRSAPPFSAIKPPVPIFTRFEPRNRRRGDIFSSLDMRVGRNTRITERLSVRGYVEFFNLLNQTNFMAFANNANSPLFLQPQAASPRRQLQFGFRLDF